MQALKSILEEHRAEAQRREEQTLFHKAALSRDHARHFGREEDHRLPYKRDVDRIIHSRAYARYIDKTQVIYLVENDHITHRVLHVQLVSNFARGVAEILRLNLDLVEAIALGHDVGHPPFGHEGEGYLSELSQELIGKPFAHPHQSCRLFREIEPLNLGLAVYDGFLCHDGGMCGTKFAPRLGKTWDDHFTDLENKLNDPDKNIWPATLEGCLVKLSDTISYLGRDIEDAVRLVILDRQIVPQTILGNTNREILSTIAVDIIKLSYEQEYIAISEEIYEALGIIRKFNFEHIYMHPKIKVESAKIKHAYRIMVESLLEDLHKKGTSSFIWTQYLKTKPEQYRESTSLEQAVIDYVAGMTDNYFVRTLQKLIVPSRIEVDRPLA
jgi:dGTPase